MKTALITGISGQGGAYLARELLAQGFKVVGTTRNATLSNTHNLKALGVDTKVTLVSLDLTSPQCVLGLIDEVRPAEIYHLAAPSSVARSFIEPADTISSIVITTVNVLDAIRKIDKTTPCFVATSTEMFGHCDSPATIDTAHSPSSPYGIGKSCTHYQVKNYRQAYGLYVCSGILSNFESPLRPRNYVTTKIVSTACEIALGQSSSIELGNLGIKRDWGGADDFMRAATLTLRQTEPADYIIATGVSSSLTDFLETTFTRLNLDYRDYLNVTESLIRPMDIKQTICNVSATHQNLGWQAEKSLDDVVSEMLFAELKEQVGEDFAAQKLGSDYSLIKPDVAVTYSH